MGSWKVLLDTGACTCLVQPSALWKIIAEFIRPKCSSFLLLPTTRAPLKVWLFHIKWVIETIWLIFSKRLQCISRTLKFYYFSLILQVPNRAKLQPPEEAQWDPALQGTGSAPASEIPVSRGPRAAPQGKGVPLESSASLPSCCCLPAFLWSPTQVSWPWGKTGGLCCCEVTGEPCFPGISHALLYIFYSGPPFSSFPPHNIH